MTISFNAVQMALRARMLQCEWLPESHAWGNIAFTPVQGQPYVEEEFVPATSTLKGLVKNGLVEQTGLYIVKWFGVSGTGERDLNAGVDSLLALFAPGSSLTASDGTVVRMRGDIAPYRGQMRVAKPGFVVVVVTVPWRLLSYTPVS